MSGAPTVPPYRASAGPAPDQVRPSEAHADDPVRRRRLRHAAVRLACGLSVTLGLMNFVNLAHGVFAMVGRLCHRHADGTAGRAFPRDVAAGLPRPRRSASCSNARSIAISMARSQLDQVLFSIGLVFMAVPRPIISWVDQRIIHLPLACRSASNSGGRHRNLPAPSSSSICGVLAAPAAVARRTRFGGALARRRRRCARARGLGINVGTIFAVTFAIGSGLAGLGGALAAEIVGLDPNFPLKFMVYFLIVVTVGGTSSITGPFLASLMLGVADVAGKYYVPAFGAFMIYSVMVARADLAAARLVRAAAMRLARRRNRPPSRRPCARLRAARRMAPVRDRVLDRGFPAYFSSGRAGSLLI